MREAILHLSDSALAAAGLEDLIDAVRRAGFRDATELVCHGSGGILLLQVDDPLPETDLDGFDSVIWWERLASSTTAVTYLCRISAPDLAKDFLIHEHGVVHDVSNICEVDWSSQSSARKTRSGKPLRQLAKRACTSSSND